MTAALITILPAEVPYEDTLTNGCLLTDSDVHFLDTHMRPKLTREFIEGNNLNPIPLSEFKTNPFKYLAKLGIDASLFKDAATYECPVLDIEYVSVVPIYLVTQDFSKYSIHDSYSESRRQMLNDASWNQHWFSEADHAKHRFADLLLGSGYTDGFLPSDGGNDYALASFKLSNGDYLIVKTFTWFNK